MNRRSIPEMAADALREGGVLMLVFYGVGNLLPRPSVGVFDVLSGLLGITLGLMSWHEGAMLERRRRE